ncbi:hypothetical protein BpHYR1_010706 [Brachionus plicatilis]|uniref:Uncharacterized protein n=1 Tax=Brachionus plicatilis TaxID=10195 RepID=A0A3M7SLC6_BRAPC|nr:hypothetical protein BpHYR1_010706 [Brachionus plicatilis]
MATPVPFLFARKLNYFYPLSVTEKSDTIGPVTLEGPTPNSLLRADMPEPVVSFKNIGWGGIGPLMLDKPSHIFQV